MGLRLAELCQEYGIAELSVFGSVARGDSGPDSDVDLLYVRVPGNDLGMSYFALQDDLEELFGRPVDLVPKDGLHRVIRDRVLADAQVLYAATSQTAHGPFASTSTASAVTGGMKTGYSGTPSFIGCC